MKNKKWSWKKTKKINRKKRKQKNNKKKRKKEKMWWVAGDWGQCSVTCGAGLQQREVGCVYQLQNGTYISTRDLYCISSKPASLQQCEGRHCLTVWEASEWSKLTQSYVPNITPTSARTRDTRAWGDVHVLSWDPSVSESASPGADR
ncbi:hypothetical protein NFI96_005554 [Prochilodus magdalenae]|nr:hypothetical protein NFI96_005554 [Prochilodus magdalenae]